MSFIPHTEEDVQSMLSIIGVNAIADLFDEIPASLRTRDLLSLPDTLGELELTRLMRQRAALDDNLLCFIGAGAYQHYIPAAVWEITGRGEFLTAYTPYQAEASQGTLQLLYEYQTMMASLMGLDVSNASLYEGGSALAEALLMTIRLQRKQPLHRILIPKTLHPHYREVVNAIVKTRGVEIIDIPYEAKTGQTSLSFLKDNIKEGATALVIPQPNFFGVLEEVDALTQWAESAGILTIGVVNPLAMALLKPPGQWGTKGADIACGEGQPLGVPLASGGPYYGFLCCKKDVVRQLPGRLVGRTKDSDGNQGFVLTLQAREQHIRRSKANSNICTNQGLLVTASTIYMSLMGPQGLRDVALLCHQKLLLLKSTVAALPGIQIAFPNSPVFHECVITLPQSADTVLAALAEYRIQGGVNITPYYSDLGESLLVCVTETKSAEEIHYFVDTLSKILQ